jgi:hypothetical protein
MRLAAGPSEPALLIAVQAAQLRESGADVSLRLGQERWMGVNTVLAFDNHRSGPSEFLRFDFKTAPVKSSESPPR